MEAKLKRLPRSLCSRHTPDCDRKYYKTWAQRRFSLASALRLTANEKSKIKAYGKDISEILLNLTNKNSEKPWKFTDVCRWTSQLNNSTLMLFFLLDSIKWVTDCYQILLASNYQYIPECVMLPSALVFPRTDQGWGGSAWDGLWRDNPG